MKINKEEQLNKDTDNEASLSGTLFSVGMVAAVIVVMWAAVFWLYMERV
ncbi:cytochrome c oxidase subunit 2A [Aquibacillus koreensis]|uniref:Cytochrome c oxidase subunit 2A n=1 Tax=Aquibacillus koreensis TaxID=279446 RepID=A0A9X4AIM8_9BACI|nr:cytochrome c oxidase subunit 2A [Aquibacillus koreensis]MCT2536337.1 cytochrome c oxidase subunit 2A [Aquibacillus koreensis]MDC3421312.1 cytochrome c oxidase subunit 2A [Aquibacillus koreensis]